MDTILGTMVQLCNEASRQTQTAFRHRLPHPLFMCANYELEAHTWSQVLMLIVRGGYSHSYLICTLSTTIPILLHLVACDSHCKLVTLTAIGKASVALIGLP